MEDRQAGPVPGDRLTGWKDIAAFLGKGVRTAQRWETEYGLPVHRLGHEGGEIVWASRLELEAWLRRDESQAQVQASDLHVSASVAQDEAPAKEPLVAVRPSETLRDREAAQHWRSRWVSIAAGSVFVMFAGAGLWWVANLVRAEGRPARIEISGRNLSALDQGGTRLWTVPLAYEAYPEIALQAGDGPWGRTWSVSDLDGDGSFEVLVMASGQQQSPLSSLHVFEHDGTERFRWNPAGRSVTFGETVYSGPWIPHSLFVSDDGRSLFASFVHVVKYPTLLVEFDTQGRVLGEYWSNGYVETVRRAMWKGRSTLFVGATNNETRGGALAIFEDSRLKGAGPSASELYRCISCPGGGPNALIVFPRRDGSLGDNTATVQELKVEENGTLHVRVSEGRRNPRGDFPASVWYSLGPQLIVNQIQLTSGLQVEHQKWHSAGLVDHPLGPRDVAESLPVRLFTAAGWAALPVKAGVVNGAIVPAVK